MAQLKGPYLNAQALGFHLGHSSFHLCQVLGGEMVDEGLFLAPVVICQPG